MDQQSRRVPDDLALVQAALEGKPEAFRSIVEIHQRGLFDLCARTLRDDAEAEDIVQETFLRFYKNMSRYRVGYKLRNWLYTIALNLCRSRLRRRKILNLISLDFLTGNAEERRPLELPGNDVQALDLLKQKETEVLLDRLVAALPDGLKAAFLMHYQQNLPDAEIASILGISLNHTRVKLSRARALLLDKCSTIGLIKKKSLQEKQA